MVIHSVSFSSRIDARTNRISVIHEFNVIDPTVDIGFGSCTAVRTAKRIHLVCVRARTKVAITHNGGPFGIGGGCWTGSATCVNGRIVAVGIV
jgi:hypothetical protein